MRCIYADPDNLNKFNKSDSGLLAQMYLQLSKSGLGVRCHESILRTVAEHLRPSQRLREGLPRAIPHPLSFRIGQTTTKRL